MHNNINVNVGGPVQASSTYRTVVLKGNIPFAEQIGDSNTKYVIKWDFDLGGESITIPQGCVLKFEGGSLNNGKIVSNKTTINGITKDNDVLYGTFYNVKGTPLSYNKKKIDDIRDSVVFGYSNESSDLSGRKTVQSIAVTEQYVFVFTLNGNSDPGVDVLDRNYNIIKECSIYAGVSNHCNDATVMGDYILVAGGYTFLKISIEDILNTPNGETVPVTSLDDLFTDIWCVDYDSVQKEIAVYDRTKIMILDDEFSVIRETEIARDAIIQSTGAASGNIQGMVYKNGQIIFNTDITDKDSCDVYKFVIFDQITKEILPVGSIKNKYYLSGEIEAICKDPVNDDILWAPINVSFGTVKYIAISKYNLTCGLIDGTDTRHIQNFAFDGTTNISVDNNAPDEIVPNGTASYPYKRLDTALLMCINYGNSIRFNLTPTNSDEQKAYLIPDGLYKSINDNLSRFSGTASVKALIDGSFQLLDGELELVDVELNGRITASNCKKITIKNCKINGNVSISYTSSVVIYNTEIDGSLNLADNGYINISTSLSRNALSIFRCVGIVNDFEIFRSESTSFGATIEDSFLTLFGLYVNTANSNGIRILRSNIVYAGTIVSDYEGNTKTGLYIINSLVTCCTANSYKSYDTTLKISGFAEGIYLTNTQIFMSASTTIENSNVDGAKAISAINYSFQNKIYVAINTSTHLIKLKRILDNHVDDYIMEINIQTPFESSAFGPLGLLREGIYTTQEDNLIKLEDVGHTGTSAQRPAYVNDGFMYFDTELGIPIFKKGNMWIDANGNDPDA